MRCTKVAVRPLPDDKFTCRDIGDRSRSPPHFGHRQMTLPRKGRTAITVDGELYHYRVRLNESGRGVIQHGSGRGPCLFILFPWPAAIMLPSHVADTIRFAIGNGWIHGDSTCNQWIAFRTDDHGCSNLRRLSIDDPLVVAYNSFEPYPKRKYIKASKKSGEQMKD